MKRRVRTSVFPIHVAKKHNTFRVYDEKYKEEFLKVYSCSAGLQT